MARVGEGERSRRRYHNPGVERIFYSVEGMAYCRGRLGRTMSPYQRVRIPLAEWKTG